jgi:hypothetical protein
MGLSEIRKIQNPQRNLKFTTNLEPLRVSFLYDGFCCFLILNRHQDRHRPMAAGQPPGSPRPTAGVAPHAFNSSGNSYIVESAGGTIAQYGGKAIIRTTETEVLEGTW